MKPASFPSAVDPFSPDDTTEAEHLEELLDEALIETFPASDPVAITSNETYAIGTIVRPLFYQHAPVLDRHCP